MEDVSVDSLPAICIIWNIQLNLTWKNKIFPSNDDNPFLFNIYILQDRASGFNQINLQQKHNQQLHWQVVGWQK